MAVSEQARRRLHKALETTVGEDNAATLMDSLPPTGWGDVATKQDLAHLADQLRAEMRAGFAELRGELRTELGAEISVLRRELGGEISVLRTEMGGLRTELRTEVGALRAELYRALRTQTLAMLSGMVALSGFVLAAARVG